MTTETGAAILRSLGIPVRVDGRGNVYVKVEHQGRNQWTPTTPESIMAILAERAA